MSRENNERRACFPLSPKDDSPQHALIMDRAGLEPAAY